MERDMNGREESEQQLQYLPTEGLTLQEDKELAVLLAKWTGGRISTPVFTELARMIPQPIVEVVIFRKNGETLETLLIPRPEDDIVWPGMYHTPGTALRLSDYYRDDENPLNGAFERIQNGELQNEFAFNPIFLGRLHRLTNVRGAEVAEIYMTEFREGVILPDGHHWYPVDQLASNQDFIQGQLGHVMLAAEQFDKKDN